jgi:hypothetical protein
MKETSMSLFSQVVDIITDHLPLTFPAHVDFRNDSGDTIHVVMDNDRESHDIAPRGQTTFTNANVGDNPTFHVQKPGTGVDLFARAMGGPIGPNASLGWNGTTFWADDMDGPTIEAVVIANRGMGRAEEAFAVGHLHKEHTI